MFMASVDLVWQREKIGSLELLSFRISPLSFWDKLLVAIIIDSIISTGAASLEQLMDCFFLIEPAVGHRFCSV